MIILHNAVPDPLPNLNRTPCALTSPTVKLRRWRATLAGGGPIEEFRKLPDDLGILNRLYFPGWLDQVGASAL
jgi:hypothetical protein